MSHTAMQTCVRTGTCGRVRRGCPRSTSNFFFSSRRRHTRWNCDWNSDVCSSDLEVVNGVQFGDLLQFVDFDYLARVTRVVGSSLAAQANSPRAPSNARLIIAAPTGFQGSNDTELRWNADPESDVVGYEIVWRDSTEPLWTHALQIGNVTDYTLTGL